MILLGLLLTWLAPPWDTSTPPTHTRVLDQFLLFECWMLDHCLIAIPQKPTNQINASSLVNVHFPSCTVLTNDQWGYVLFPTVQMTSICILYLSSIKVSDYRCYFHQKVSPCKHGKFINVDFCYTLHWRASSQTIGDDLHVVHTNFYWLIYSALLRYIFR